MLKTPELSRAESGLFRFQFGGLRGFQKGDPAKTSVVDLDVFDENDRELKIFMGRTKGTEGIIRQEDVNTVLSSIRRWN
jgi:hypothetical protein